MYQFILRNLDKIFISFSGLVLFELIQKHYNLKKYRNYNNYYIKNDNIYHIDVYKKNNLNNRKNYHKYKAINFIYIPYLEHLNSISFIKNNDIYEVFNNIKYVNPKKFLYYNNDNIFENIVKLLGEKKDTQHFINFIELNKFDKNIRYKISQNKNSMCLYLNDKLLLISDNFNDIIVKSIEDEIKYITCSLIFGIFIYLYQQNKNYIF